MDADEDGTARGDIALDERHMLGRVNGGGIDFEVERSAISALDFGFGDDLDFLSRWLVVSARLPSGQLLESSMFLVASIIYEPPI